MIWHISEVFFGVWEIDAMYQYEGEVQCHRLACIQARFIQVHALICLPSLDIPHSIRDRVKLSIRKTVLGTTLGLHCKGAPDLSE